MENLYIVLTFVFNTFLAITCHNRNLPNLIVKILLSFLSIFGIILVLKNSGYIIKL